MEITETQEDEFTLLSEDGEAMTDEHGNLIVCLAAEDKAHNG